MRITILQGAFLPVPALRGGAIEKAWDALGQCFADAGHKVTHISRKCNGLPEEEKIGDVRHLRVQGFDGVKNSFLLKLLETFYVLRAKKLLPPADILITHAFWAPLLFNKEKFGKMYVHVGRYPKGQLRFYKKASRFQVPTKAIFEAVKKEIPERSKEISVLPYPINWKVEKSGNYLERSSTLLFLGRIHPEKGVTELIKAFKNIPLNIRKGWKLIIRGPWRFEQGGGGESYLSQVKDEAKECGSVIEILEPTFSVAELRKSLEAAKLFVYPSSADKGETFGLAVLEAMSCGCVPIVSSLECFQDLVADQKNGYVFNHRSNIAVQLLSSKLEDAIQSQENNIRFSNECFKMAKEYEAERLARKYIQDFKVLLDLKPLDIHS
ncbi:MAG: glycosyltransferase family 4 protein [Opitutae bacterium]|nr:glycosyltransferase family 4 protein [Opitutae bacterium]MBT5715646.1 glycosyltransferase family 4 protein [Opitutae bacterium]